MFRSSGLHLRPDLAHTAATQGMISEDSTCRICGCTAQHRRFFPREMMFGTKEVFEYFQCSRCDCLQISEIPANLSQYYPKEYYSFAFEPPKLVTRPWVVKTMQQWRTGHALFGRGHKQAGFAKRFVEPPPEFLSLAGILERCRINSFGASFLDIGCGSSSWWLRQLQAIGFRRLIGIDPFIPADTEDNGIPIRRTSLDAVEGKFDVISMHHSLEHSPDQIGALTEVARRLNPGGCCVIRIPLVSSLVWEMFNVDWVELDAPRHLFLHSLRSLEEAAQRSGLKIYSKFWDSTEFEFWGSEQYRRNIALMSEDSYLINPDNSNFTFREMATFKKLAEQANSDGRGGRGCFFLERSAS